MVRIESDGDGGFLGGKRGVARFAGRAGVEMGEGVRFGYGG